MHWQGGVVIEREGMRERKERGRKRKDSEAKAKQLNAVVMRDVKEITDDQPPWGDSQTSRAALTRLKETQMNGERGGPHCGLTSLLPMSCRGRAAAFARDLHSRLRNLGAAHPDDAENTWLTRDLRHAPSAAAAAPSRDPDTFYDFELECESPSSPVDELDGPFAERAPAAEPEPPFYDVDADPEPDDRAVSSAKLQRVHAKTNGFRFSTSFYTDGSPVKVQPVPRENGHVDKPLYSPITFEGCVRQNSFDEVDSRPPPTKDLRLPLSISTLDSDSEFESAKSDPSDGVDDCFDNETKLDTDATECLENLSLNEEEHPLADDGLTFESDERIVADDDVSLKIVTSEVPQDKEVSPAPEIDASLLSADLNDDVQETEIEDDRPQRIRRCSSLKTGKTPPGTPGRKKIVRFADVLGLDLADVKTFMDEIPVIPKSAYDDLTGCDIFQNSPPTRAPPRLGALTLVPLFQLPRDVSEKLEKQNVCLETARVGDGGHVNICGTVRVRNLDYHKTVHIRYTMDRWKTYTDLQTTYVPGSCDGYSDRFQFVLYAPCITAGQRLEIAVRFQCKGQQLWDNNSGANYCFDCLALGVTTPALASSCRSSAANSVGKKHEFLNDLCLLNRKWVTVYGDGDRIASKEVSRARKVQRVAEGRARSAKARSAPVVLVTFLRQPHGPASPEDDAVSGSLNLLRLKLVKYL
ncbi:Glycogen-binding subunit 76A [Eumeta japonica]|uniref:Glycogen-binding subunit 76A n=1 Tax=Eumeta variegata TaxID=151549 RepID=A0A4C1TY85_EUMVA|nr:Glycogen-binding subunit 76A [Eumeta japonica]